jgi:tRNA A37 methylthiotransferase MiaB
MRVLYEGRMINPARAAIFYLRSFGCQMNDHDSERISGMLRHMGMSQSEAPENAGVLVYNTCSIREKADSRLAGHLGLAARLKREDPTRIVVVAGCLPQSRREELLQEYPFVDVLVGPQSLHELPGMLRTRRRLSGGDDALERRPPAREGAGAIGHRADHRGLHQLLFVLHRALCSWARGVTQCH